MKGSECRPAQAGWGRAGGRRPKASRGRTRGPGLCAVGTSRCGLVGGSCGARDGGSARNPPVRAGDHRQSRRRHCCHGVWDCRPSRVVAVGAFEEDDCDRSSRFSRFAQPGGDALGLANPVCDGLRGRLELPGKLCRRSPGSDQLDHLTPELGRIGASKSRHRTLQKMTSRMPTKNGSTPTPTFSGVGASDKPGAVHSCPAEAPGHPVLAPAIGSTTRIGRTGPSATSHRSCCKIPAEHPACRRDRRPETLSSGDPADGLGSEGRKLPPPAVQQLVSDHRNTETSCTH